MILLVFALCLTCFVGCESAPGEKGDQGVQGEQGTSLTSVTFKNPNGWWYTSSSDATSGTSIPSSSLVDASTAAGYLTDTYDSYYWKRS